MQHSGLQQIKSNIQPYDKKQVGGTLAIYDFTNLNVTSEDNKLKTISLTILNFQSIFIKEEEITRIEFFQKNTDKEINIGKGWFGGFNYLDIPNNARIKINGNTITIILKEDYQIHEDIKNNSENNEGKIQITFKVKSEAERAQAAQEQAERERERVAAERERVAAERPQPQPQAPKKETTINTDMPKKIKKGVIKNPPPTPNNPERTPTTRLRININGRFT